MHILTIIFTNIHAIFLRYSPASLFYYIAVYAKVIRMLGNGRLEAYCFDKKIRTCRIPGRLLRKIWITPNDIILMSKRDCDSNDEKGDVILKYAPDEVRTLKANGHLPMEVIENDDDNMGVDFVNDDGNQDDEADDNDDDDDSSVDVALI